MSTTFSRQLVRRTVAPASPAASLRRLALCGQLAGPLMLAAILVLDWLDPNVSSLADPISYLGARGAPYAPAMNAMLALSGLLFAGGALALQRVLPRVPGRWQPVLVVALFGIVGMLGAALLPCDFHCSDGSLQGKLHYVPAAMGWGLLLFGLRAMPSQLALDPGWAAHATWPPRLLQASLVLSVLFQLGGQRIVPALHPYVGLIQRLFLLAVFAALYAAARRLRRLVSS